MAIQKLIEFAKTGQKDTDQLDIETGFIVNRKPARQWFNWLFNTLTVKINEIIDADFIQKNDIVDNLTTEDAAKPVSAKQAKLLQDNKVSKEDTIALNRGGTGAKSAAAARTNLELGSAAVKNTTLSNTDRTVGNVLCVGDFGLGGEILINEGKNLNQLTVPGFYGCDRVLNATAALNYPAVGQLGNLQVLGSSGSNGYKVQIFTTTSIRRQFMRQTGDDGNTWSSWSEFAFTDTTVAKSNIATKLETPRAIALSGDLTGTANFDGSAGINIAASLGAKSLSAVGYKVIGDIVLQWGSVNVPINSISMVTLPIAVSSIMQAFASYDYPSSAAYPTLAIGDFTSTTLKIGINIASGSSFTIRWIAICKK